MAIHSSSGFGRERRLFDRLKESGDVMPISAIDEWQVHVLHGRSEKPLFLTRQSPILFKAVRVSDKSLVTFDVVEHSDLGGEGSGSCYVVNVPTPKHASEGFIGGIALSASSGEPFLVDFRGQKTSANEPRPNLGRLREEKNSPEKPRGRIENPSDLQFLSDKAPHLQLDHGSVVGLHHDFTVEGKPVSLAYKILVLTRKGLLDKSNVRELRQNVADASRKWRELLLGADKPVT